MLSTLATIQRRVQRGRIFLAVNRFLFSPIERLRFTLVEDSACINMQSCEKVCFWYLRGAAPKTKLSKQSEYFRC